MSDNPIKSPATTEEVVQYLESIMESEYLLPDDQRFLRSMHSLMTRRRVPYDDLTDKQQAKLHTLARIEKTNREARKKPEASKLGEAQFYDVFTSITDPITRKPSWVKLGSGVATKDGRGISVQLLTRPFGEWNGDCIIRVRDSRQEEDES